MSNLNFNFSVDTDNVEMTQLYTENLGQSKVKTSDISAVSNVNVQSTSISNSFGGLAGSKTEIVDFNLGNKSSAKVDVNSSSFSNMEIKSNSTNVNMKDLSINSSSGKFGQVNNTNGTMSNVNINSASANIASNPNNTSNVNTSLNMNVSGKNSNMGTNSSSMNISGPNMNLTGSTNINGSGNGTSNVNIAGNMNNSSGITISSSGVSLDIPKAGINTEKELSNSTNSPFSANKSLPYASDWLTQKTTNSNSSSSENLDVEIPGNTIGNVFDSNNDGVLNNLNNMEQIIKLDNGFATLQEELKSKESDLAGYEKSNYSSVLEIFFNNLRLDEETGTKGSFLKGIISVIEYVINKNDYIASIENSNAEQKLEDTKTGDLESIITTPESTAFVQDTIDKMLTMMKDVDQYMHTTDVSQDGVSIVNTDNETIAATDASNISSSKIAEQVKVASNVVQSALNNELGNTAEDYTYSGAWCAWFAWDKAKIIAKDIGVYLGTPYDYTSTGSLMSHFRDTEGLELIIKHDGQIDYTPKPGDFIFIDTYNRANSINWSETNDIQEHTAMVASYDAETRTVTTIEGNWNNKVSTRELSLDDSSLIGFGSYYGN